MLPTLDDFYVGVTYVVLGVLGIMCNGTTMVMIVLNRVYRLSAYTLMANIALADSVLLIVAGVVCGISFAEKEQHNAAAASIDFAKNTTTSASVEQKPMTNANGAMLILSAMQISSWTAGVLSYALLGLNRCIAICYYGTRVKALNQISVAIGSSLSTWALGLIAGIVGTFPVPLLGIRQDMYTISVLQTTGDRAFWFFLMVFALNLVAIVGQWVCSLLVLLKIREVKQKISKNKLNQNSANRFRRQAKLTFQFFYPSILCTISTVMMYTKPFLFARGVQNQWFLVSMHVIWLFNHTCNPFIYAYFNERMRITYKQLLTCAQLRYEISKRRLSNGFGTGRHNVSRRSNGAGMMSNRMSVRSTRTGRDGNFVRNSLQMQSRDFEQLCEFMMRVNPFYDSSEGWRESSDDEDDEHRERGGIEAKSGEEQEHQYSVVLGMGRRTVEQWVKFSKKASL